MRHSKIVRAVPGILIMATALCFAVLIIWVTSEDQQYRRRAHPNFSFRYPFVEVSGSCALLIGEALVVRRLLSEATTSPFRPLIAFGACLAGATTMFLTVLAPDHVPNYIVLHFFWLLCAGAISGGMCLIACFRS
jgi:hypothetical protein